ncbi:Ionotropic receptor 75h [Blattella germanica]|nr:Ionotropic receptor 75h [Blattella germanica]
MKMTWIKLLLSIILILFSKGNARDMIKDSISIIKQFYEHKKVSLVTAVVCWGKYELSLMKALALSGIRVNFAKEPDTLAKVLDHDTHYRSGAVVDMACKHSHAALKHASFKKQFDIHKFWLLLSPPEENAIPYGNTSYDVVYSVDRNMFPDGVLKDEEIFNVSISLTEFEIGALSGLRILENSEVILMQNPQIINESDQIKILYPHQFTYWEDMTLRHVDKWTKIHWPVFGYLSEQMNFTFDVNYQEDNYGWLINGSFNGMMGYMQREEVEFPSTGIFIRKDRFAVTDYCADTFKLRATVMFRQPSLSTVSNIFMLPFDTAVWMCCLAYCLIIMIILGLQITFTIRQKIEQDMINSGWSDILTFVLGAICQQGFHITPSTLAGRTTVFILTLSSLFLFTSYSANIVALLQTPSTSFKTVKDLTESSMVLGVENQTYNRVYMQETTDAELKEFYFKKIAPMGEKVYCDPVIGMANIKKRLHAFQVDTTAAYKIMSETYEEYEKCGLQEIDLFPSPVFTIAVTRGSPLRDYFSVRVRWYREIGLLGRLFKIWMPQKAKCESSAGGFVSVGMTEFYPALMVLQYGTLVAVIIFVAEKLYFYRTHMASKVLQICPRQKIKTDRKPPKADNGVKNTKQLLNKQNNWLT